MILISRRLGEAPVIGDDIFVQIVDIDRDRVRIGVSAPPDCRVWKEEWLPAPFVVDSGTPPQESDR